MTSHDDRRPDDDQIEDEELMGVLRRAAWLDEVPPEMIAAARASFVARTLDAELAELVADSCDAGAAFAGVRSTGTVRMLTFQSPALTIEVEAVHVNERRRLVGQLVPPQPASVELRGADGVTTVAADELGRFFADDLSPGPVSLRCVGTAGHAISTEWVLI